MSTETERLAELVVDLGQRLSQAFGDLVSPEAQRHLRNAQREALTALFLIYEEQLDRRTGRTTGRRRDDDPEDDGEAGWPSTMEELLGRRGLRRDREPDEESEPADEAEGARDAGHREEDPPPPSRPPRRRRSSPRVQRIDLD